MSSNIYPEICNAAIPNCSVTIKIEEPEGQGNMHYHHGAHSSTNYTQLKSEIYDENIMMDFIENSIDSLFVEYAKEKPPKMEKKARGAERQRIYRQNETQSQREHRLQMAREYIRKRRQIESEQERYTRLKEQRERVRTIRDAIKSDPEIHKVRKHIEAERMRLRRANETPSQRNRRLEKSRVYSKKRRENQVYRIIENEKNRLAHRYKRADEAFRLQERLRDRARKKIKKKIMDGTHAEIHTPELVICDSDKL